MWKPVRSVGLAFASVKGWLFAVSLMPAVLTYLLGFYEGLPWAAIAAYSTAALALGVWLAWGFLKLYEAAAGHFTAWATRSRINSQLREYVDAGETMVDTPTAAAIWAGTLDADNIQRHLYFRMIKLAIAHGVIKNAQFKDGIRKVNMYTKIPLEEFIKFLQLKGVLK
jgi:hypothetical protein